MLTQEKLKALLCYDPETGIFIWIGSPRPGWNGKIAGTEIKTKSRATYTHIGIRGKYYKAHRLAWLYVNGSLPEKLLDHIDGNGQNNAISNLRIASNSENIRNSAIKRNNSSGVKNVHWESSAGKWRVSFRVTPPGEKSRNINGGLFTDLEKAKAKARAMREQLHGEFANHG